MTRLTGTPPPAIRRDQSLRNTERTLSNESAAALKQAGKELDAALGDAGKAGQAAGSAATNVADAAWDGLKAAGNTAKGVGAAVVGGVARAAEVVADQLGAALQWFGKALTKVGNASREIAGMGGPQVVTRTIEGDKSASLFSDRMFKISRDAFSVAGNQWRQSLAHLVSSGRDLRDASAHVLSAAEHTVNAAAAAGDGVALKAAQGAVALSRKALMAMEQGLDGAGALLQQAGEAVIAAGNQVNTARGNDTAVAVRSGSY